MIGAGINWLYVWLSEVNVIQSGCNIDFRKLSTLEVGRRKKQSRLRVFHGENVAIAEVGMESAP